MMAEEEEEEMNGHVLTTSRRNDKGRGKKYDICAPLDKSAVKFWTPASHTDQSQTDTQIDRYIHKMSISRSPYGLKAVGFEN